MVTDHATPQAAKKEKGNIITIIKQLWHKTITTKIKTKKWQKILPQ